MILKIDPLNPDLEAIKLAAGMLKRGGIVAFPTETVYGLGCDTFNSDAARRVFEAKMRPPDNPLIVHIASLEQLELVARRVPEDAYKLAERFWPGPLTLILEKKPQVPSIVTGGLDTVAVRMPAHPVALKLVEYSERPIAAPSANISGRPSPTRGEHVIRDLYGRVDAIIDAGETLYGVESTIVDILSDPPRVLRLGAYPVEVIERELGRKLEIPAFARGVGEAERALAPGMRYRHYSPQTPLILVEASSYSNLDSYAREVLRLAERLRREGRRVAVVASRETARVYSEAGFMVLELGSRSNPYELARNLYNTLRLVDEIGVDIALAEGFEEKSLGLTVMSRLRKASSEKIRVEL